MPFLDQELKNFSAKGWLGIFGSGDRDTSPDAFAWYEELYSLSSIVTSSQVWNEFNSLPSASTLAEANTNVAGNPSLLAAYQGAGAIHCTPSPNNRLFLATSTYGDTTTTLKNWLLPQLIPTSSGNPSIGYATRFYQGNPNSGGTEITTTQGKEDAVVSWFFHYGSGIFKISADFTGITDPTDVWMTGFRYIGATGGGGGTTTDVSSLVMLKTCDSGAVVGDIVAVDTNNIGKVVVLIDNTSVSLGIGVISEKTGSTSCKVLTYGPCAHEFTGALTKGKKVFLSPSGGVTTTKPTSGYMQELGYAYEEDKLFVTPSTNRVLLH